MLEDLKQKQRHSKRSSTKWGIHFDVAHKEEKIAELEYKMGEPTFWDDAEQAQKINQELNDVKISVDKYKALCTKADDSCSEMWHGR